MSDPAVNNMEEQNLRVNQRSESGDDINLAQPQNEADRIAGDRDDVDEQNMQLPSEVTDNLGDGADQVFMAAFQNSQKDGLSREAAMQVAWNSVKVNYDRDSEGNWHLREKPRDRTYSAPVEGSAS